MKKPKSSQTITKRMAFLGLIGILMISVIGGVGWQKWQDHQLKAKAAGWSSIVTYNGLSFLQCKTSVNSAYGPLWKIKIVMANGSKYNTTGTYKVMRNSILVSNLNFSATPGQWDVKETYASQSGDTFLSSYIIGPSNIGGGGTGSGGYGNIATC